MKNLLKSVMLTLIVVSFFGCETEEMDVIDQDQSVLNRDSFSTNYGPCEESQSLAKFVNNGSYATDFKVYDSEGIILTSEFLTPRNSSDLKSISPGINVTIVSRNFEYTFSRTINMKKCMLYSFVIDASNNLNMYKHELY